MDDETTLNDGAVLVALLALMAACARVRPERMATDRMDFGQVIAEPWTRRPC
jgi:hypothetical protein